MQEAGHDRGVEALRRGLAILGAFDPAGQPMTLTELAARSDLSPSTTLRLVRTLVAEGYVDRDPLSKRYSPGIASMRLAHLGYGTYGPREVARPFLADLRRRTGQNVSMGVRMDREVILVERLTSPQVVLPSVHVGSRLPAYCSSLGKVLLSELNDTHVAQLYRGASFEQHGPKTVRSLDALLDLLREARSRGFATQDEESAPGLRSAAAALRDRSGVAVAAIAVSCSTFRVSRTDLASRIAAQVVRTAEDISSALGYPATPTTGSLAPF